MKRKPTIYPELIKPGEWVIEEWDPATSEHAPCTDNAGRRAWVPSGNSKFAKEVKFHELLHVKYSPDSVPEVPGVTPPSILSAEDCRVNLKGTLIRPHDALGATPMPDPFLLATSKTERGIAQLAAACLGYTSSDKFLDNLAQGLGQVADMRALPPWLRSHAATLRDAVFTVRYDAASFCEPLATSTFDDTIELARWLDETFSDGAPGPGRGPNPDAEPGDYDEAPDEGGNAEDAIWGEMRVETPPLSVRHPNALGRRTSPSAQGSRIRHPGRMVTGEIFGRTRKASTPDAVLIDDSGSMHWEEEKLYELVKQIPVGVIAAYSGDCGTGVLRVLARDGRMVAPELVSTPYGGNEVDGPALRWLAKQKGRKVWVSDQGVCSDGGSEEALLADCNAVVKANGIRVCLTTNPAEIMRALRGR